MFLSDLSIKRPVLATMMIVALVTLGVFSYRRLSVDLWPEVEFPFVSISTEYSGASPEAVEREVTKKIEESVNSIEGVKKITSVSNEGFSSIYIEFQLKTKVMDAVADVRSRIDRVRPELPAAIEAPVIDRFDAGATPILTYSLRGAGWTLRDLTTLAEETVSRRLQNVPGVGSVSVVGGVRREVQVLLLPDRMQALQVSPDMVVAAVQRENTDMPAGRVERGSREDLVRVKGRIANPKDFERIVVSVRGGIPVRLGQVARIEDAQEEVRDAAFVNGERAVAIEIRKVSGGNTVEIADGLAERVARLNSELPRGAQLAPIQDNSVWIRNSVEDVQKTLVEGAILTVLIVFIFLNSWRSTVITGLTLPVSVIASFLAFYAFGFTLNTMTLMALSLVIGILIDDAIVVRENIVRHVERGEDHLTAASRGTAEIGFAVIATTLSIVAVFVPVAFMGGIVGKFFYQFGIVVAFAVMVSLFVSFTLDPMLSSKWYDPQAEGHPPTGPVGKLLKRFNDGFHGLGRRYRGVIQWALRHRMVTLGIAALALIGAFVMPAVGLVGGEFMPKSDEERTLVGFETAVGSSIDYTIGRGLEIQKLLDARPEVLRTYLSVGGSQQNGAIHRGQVYVQMKPKHERKLSQQAFETDLRKTLVTLQGVTGRILQLGAVGGSQAPIVLNLNGPDLATLQKISDQALAKVRDVPGLVELKSSLEGRKPEFVIDVDRGLAAEVGLSVGQIGAALRPILSGEKAGDWEDPTGLSHDVRVRLAPEFRSSGDDLARVPIATSQIDPRSGAPVMVPLQQVARLRRDGAPAQIDRQQLERVVTIEGNYQGRPLTDVVKDIQDRLGAMQLPPGYRFDFGGEQADFVETIGFMVESLTLAVVFLYIILASQFGSFLKPLAIMLSLPLSLIGVMMGLALTRGTLNIMSMIGIIMLMGLVTKNAILLVDFVNAARERGQSREEALVDAGEMRLRPIVMTTLAMIFGMLPTALALGSGAEFRAPMAHAVIGGLITSTLLTLVVVPVVYTFLDDLGTRSTALIKRFTSAPAVADATHPHPEHRPTPAAEPHAESANQPVPSPFETL
ncbi:MAG: efflux RND transporter permease subunit [Candidatus Eisenbacteria bacterium]|uniref:Efflux RND transporter permease subunit n=1 Tax=Eiseniibacteriota bacterium TaxID=2212470 RepID=A0A849SRH7_UNCEI|nr:efflux RND transporter permease subunit [Candidatus Eisenbacteria bacterium]